jgi:MFS family permease
VKHNIDEKSSNKVLFLRLCSVFFLFGMSLGFWMPALTNILLAAGLSQWWVALTFLLLPISSIISPLFIGTLADQKVAAQKLACWLSLVSGVVMLIAFWCLEKQMNPLLFLGFFFVYALVSAPVMGLVTTIALVHLPSPIYQFPWVRMCATISWILAGWGTSLVLQADASAVAGYAGGITRILLAGVLLFAPHTPPVGTTSSWKSALGLDALKLLKEKDLRCYMICAVLLSMPLTAFYMNVPEHLRSMGDMKSSFTMTFGQWSEIVAMIMTGWLMYRFRIRRIFMLAILLSIARFGFYYLAGVKQEMFCLWLGIMLHGLCYTLFFVTGQIFLDRQVEAGMRGQMQGLFIFGTNGVGTLLGTICIKFLHSETVEKGNNWAGFWGVLTIFSILVAIWFAYYFTDEHLKNQKNNIL